MALPLWLHLINIHYHGDHVGGNAAFRKDGATIMVHDAFRNHN